MRVEFARGSTASTSIPVAWVVDAEVLAVTLAIAEIVVLPLVVPGGGELGGGGPPRVGSPHAFPLHRVVDAHQLAAQLGAEGGSGEERGWRVSAERDEADVVAHREAWCILSRPMSCCINFLPPLSVCCSPENEEREREGENEDLKSLAKVDGTVARLIQPFGVVKA